MAARPVASRLLDVMERDVLPMTERGVAAGNKVFGAALLRKSDMSVVIARHQQRNGQSAVARRDQHAEPVL